MSFRVGPRIADVPQAVEFCREIARPSPDKAHEAVRTSRFGGTDGE